MSLYEPIVQAIGVNVNPLEPDNFCPVARNPIRADARLTGKGGRMAGFTRADGETYSPEDRQIALEVWAFEADRNAAKTSAMLAELHDLEIKPATIRQWAHRHDWDVKAADLFRSLSPKLYERAAFMLMRAAVPAARYVLDVTEGRATPDKVRLAAADSALNRT